MGRLRKRRSFIPVLIILLCSGLMLAYSLFNPSQSTPTNPVLLLGNEDIPAPPPLDRQMVAQGQELYDQYCAACHGLNGAGQLDWKIPNDDGSFKPPPHDISGHTWHHDDDLLLEIVTQGSDYPQSQMPTFGDQLTDDEVKAVLEYIKSWWGPEERAFQWQVTWQAQQLK